MPSSRSSQAWGAQKKPGELSTRSPDNPGRDQRYAIAAAAAIGGSKLNYYDGYKFWLHQQRLLK
jgi:hypothetical protein